MRRQHPHAAVFLLRLSQAVLRQASEDLKSADPDIREDAVEFLFGAATLPLEKWLVLSGCTDVEEFQESLMRKLQKKAT